MAKVTEIQPHWDDKIVARQDPDLDLVTLFLAGTIDMGNSDDWQHKFIEELKTWDNNYQEYVVYNPRRDEGFGDDPKEFEYQVNWELERLERVDTIVMHILGTSKSPITLMELGLFAKSGRLVVICEPNFYRYGNVRITCKRYNVPLFESMEEYIKACKDGPGQA